MLGDAVAVVALFLVASAGNNKENQKIKKTVNSETSSLATLPTSRDEDWKKWLNKSFSQNNKSQLVQQNKKPLED